MSWGQGSQRSREPIENQIAPFRMTGYEGYVLMSYLRDAYSSQSPPIQTLPGVTSSQTISQFRTDVFLMTHSYVYLPEFLTLDLGAGPVLDDGRYDADGAATRSTKWQYNLIARAAILRDKPYRGTLFYEHLNPTQFVGPAQVVFNESDRYGLTFSLLSPVTPVPIFVDATHYRNQGRGVDQTIDDSNDQVSVRANARVGKLGDSQLRFESIRQESRSGSSGLPIVESHSKSDLFNADTRLRFGAEGQYYVDNTFNYWTQNYTSSQGTLADTRDIRFDLNFRGLHSEALQTYARYVLNANRADEQEINVNGLNAGATYRQSKDLYASIGATADFIRATQFDTTNLGLTGSVTYQKELPVGQASASYSVSALNRDQKASADSANVVGERVALAGTNYVSLKHPQVTPGSVVVNNASRTQTFIEGVDYSLSVVGLVTRIQRLVGGNILDGQEVLVDYSFLVGGTYAINDLTQNVSLNWNYGSYLSVYVRLTDLKQRLQSGAPTFQINPTQDRLVGTRADVPLPFLGGDWTIGGFVEYEDRQEVISPGKRTAYEAYVQTGVPWVERSTIRIGTRRNKVDYELYPLQGVNLTAYDLRFWSQPVRGFDFSIDATRERDTGTPDVRDRTYVTAKAQWRVRQFRLSFDYTRTYDAQGGSSRTRDYAQLVLRRDF